jgi:predicted glycosyltransferase
MHSKPVLLFYCQHSLGMGHLVRAITLAEAMTKQFEVIFINGGRFPDHAAIPSGVTAINLPPLGMNDDNQLYSQDSRYSLADAQSLRKQLILSVFKEYRPHALLIELFPFGRKKFAGELIPLLKVAHRQTPGPARVFCSVRDIMVNARKDQLRHDNRARWLVDRYFDGVLVHSDPQFAMLAESFAPSRPLTKPVHYTGFVVPADKAAPNYSKRQGLLVSVGGGMVGAPLLQLAIQIQPHLWAKYHLTMTLVAGPFLPDNDWHILKQQAEGKAGLTLYRQVPNMAELLASHSLSISQGGYNTVMDILKSGIKALIVPFAQGQENEQSNRAARLSRLGLLRSVSLAELDEQGLIREVEHLLNFSPSTLTLDLTGARRSAEIMAASLTNNTGVICDA